MSGQIYVTQAGEANVFSRLGLAKKGLAAFERAVELAPNSVDARFGLMQYHLQAPGIAGGDKEVAREQAEAIAALDPVQGHLAAAAVARAEGDAPTALEAYRYAIEADPANSDARLALALTYAQEGRPQDAFAELDELVRRDPSHLQGHYQFGRLASESGLQLERGLDSFDRFLELGPDQSALFRSWAHYRSGIILEKLDAPERALGRYEAALAIDEDHDEARKAAKRLRRSLSR